MYSIRAMTTDDIPSGLRLKEQAGWNQLPADWKRMLDISQGGTFLAENGEGRALATAASWTFGPVAWVAMMLVDQEHRRQGIGRTLLEHLLDYLHGQGIESIRLDATPLGRPLYESLGFRDEAVINRFQGLLAPCGEENQPGLPPVSWEDQAVSDLDFQATGAIRIPLLRRIHDEYPQECRAIQAPGGLEGFLLGRPGSNSFQIGPCIAPGEAGERLLNDAFRRHSGQSVIVDVPEANLPAMATALRSGLLVQRQLFRMGLGRPVKERLDWIWACAGPEKG